MSVSQIQFLRCLIPNFRPDPTQLLPGQPAVNLDAAQPGLFFSDSNNVLFKVGPVAVGSIPPNSAPTGSLGNARGELWFDTNVQLLKIWNGTSWVECNPTETSFAQVIVQTLPPDKTVYPVGALWWNDYNGEMYVLYEDTNGRQWVQVGAGGSGGAGNVIISDQQPDVLITPVGSLWWNDSTGSLFVLYNDGGPEKLWIQIAGAGAINAGQGGSVTKIDAGTGLTTLNGEPITTQGTLELLPPTDNDIGGVKAGTNVTIDPDGTINFVGSGSGTVTQINTGVGISGGPITSTGTLTLNTATTANIGGVRPGAGTGVTGDGQLFIEPATTSTIGGIVVGQGLNVTAGGVLAVDSVPPGSVPSGLVQWFAGSTAPTGWLYCNGAVLETATYPDLYAAIGRTYTGSTVPSTQFQIPDLRGQFLRGWDNRASGGVDNARAFGSSQNDTFASHRHSLTLHTGDYGAAFKSDVACLMLNNDQMQGVSGGRNNIDKNPIPQAGGEPIGLTGDGETRPKNYALLPIIKT